MMEVMRAQSAPDTQCDCVQTLTGEECERSTYHTFTDGEGMIISKLISIEGRISTIETSMSWFKFVARGGVISLFGFFGLNIAGVV